MEGLAGPGYEMTVHEVLAGPGTRCEVQRFRLDSPALTGRCFDQLCEVLAEEWCMVLLMDAVPVDNWKDAPCGRLCGTQE